MQEDIWQVLREKLPYGTDEESKEKRQKIWSGFDVNGNGYLSLAQIDKGMRDLKPVLMRAYQASKAKLKSNNEYGDDYVSRAEFRYLLKYLRQYYQYWVAFDQVDKDDDRRISIDQFKKGIPAMKKWGIQGDAQQLFAEADADHKGMILFNEFCEWAIRKNLDIDTDDDVL